MITAQRRNGTNLGTNASLADVAKHMQDASRNACTAVISEGSEELPWSKLLICFGMCVPTDELKTAKQKCSLKIKKKLV